MSIDTLLQKYPKKRPPLPDAIAKIYDQHYKDNREGNTTATSVAQKMERWLHKKVAEDTSHLPKDTTITTLEIGAGTLNQLQYEPQLGPYDIIEPFKKLYENNPNLNRIRNIYTDISDIPDNAQYDRITAIATFEHICDLPQVIERSAKLLKKTGTLRISIPSEGTLLWTLGWKLTTGIEFKLKHGEDYGQLMKHEHVNTAKEIEQLLKHYFKTVKCSAFGVCKSLSFYQYFECKN